MEYELRLFRALPTKGSYILRKPKVLSVWNKLSLRTKYTFSVLVIVSFINHLGNLTLTQVEVTLAI